MGEDPFCVCAMILFCCFNLLFQSLDGWGCHLCFNLTVSWVRRRFSLMSLEFVDGGTNVSDCGFLLLFVVDKHFPQGFKQPQAFNHHFVCLEEFAELLQFCLVVDKCAMVSCGLFNIVVLFACFCEVEVSILDNDGIGLLEAVFEFIADFFDDLGYSCNVFFQFVGSIDTSSGNDVGLGWSYSSVVWSFCRLSLVWQLLYSTIQKNISIFLRLTVFDKSQKITKIFYTPESDVRFPPRVFK